MASSNLFAHRFNISHIVLNDPETQQTLTLLPSLHIRNQDELNLKNSEPITVARCRKRSEMKIRVVDVIVIGTHDEDDLNFHRRVRVGWVNRMSVYIVGFFLYFCL